MRWYQIKDPLVRFLGLSHDAAHVHFGLAVFLVITLLLRKMTAAPLIALAVVLGLELANEIADAFDWVNWTGQVNLPETAKDIASTMLWPVIATAIWYRLRRPR
jgi:hypothetical protein